MRAGLMACSPAVPVVAISIGILELYYRIRRHAPRLGIQPFVRALCDKYMVRVRSFPLGVALTVTSVCIGLTYATSLRPHSMRISPCSGRCNAGLTAHLDATLLIGARSTPARLVTTRSALLLSLLLADPVPLSSRARSRSSSPALWPWMAASLSSAAQTQEQRIRASSIPTTVSHPTRWTSMLTK